MDQTQDVEEVKVKEEPRPDPEEIRRRQEEADRIRRERAEAERIEREPPEQERIERERQEKADRLNKLGQNAFGNKGVGETEGSQGVAGGTGNQGDPNGSPDADRYGTGGGLGNQPYSYGLGSRKSRGAWPLPDMSGCEVTSKITIRVEIQVDKDGNVVGTPVVLEATYQNKCIWDMVIDAAMRSKFTADQAATYRQKGWIRYIITP